MSSPIDIASPQNVSKERTTSFIRFSDIRSTVEVDVKKPDDVVTSARGSFHRRRQSEVLALPTPIGFLERPIWGRHLDFIVTCIGFAVGLGNIWRFPHLVYSNGGGVFLIPYTISLFLLGIPLFCLEILFGQFASLGPITIWEINPLFKGLGYTMVILSGIISVYYNVVVATAIFYFFASMQNPLPWTHCGNVWNTCNCRTPNMSTGLDDPMMWHAINGLNCSGLNFTVDQVVSPSEEYFYRYVLHKSRGIQEPGKVKWDLTLCNLLGWIIIGLCLIKGVSSMGKVAYFFALFPYVLLTVLLVRGVTLEGAEIGLRFYLTPNIDKLYIGKALITPYVPQRTLRSANSSLLEEPRFSLTTVGLGAFSVSGPKVWQDAASQIFFSLSCCTGSLSAMASYNKFDNNVLRDSIVIPIINCLTSFYAGFAIFSILGFMAQTKGVAIEHVTTEGPGLVFVTYPEALSLLPVPQLWSSAFFFMMICLGLGTQFPSVETVLTALQDEFLFFRRANVAMIFRVLVCVLGFLLGIPMTTEGGFYLLDLLDRFIAFPLLLVGFFEIFAIVWIYGYKRFSEDILLMVGQSRLARCLFVWYYSWNWLVVTPCVILGIIIFECVKYQPITSPEYPEWAELLGWSVVGFIVVWTPLWYIIKTIILCREKPGDNCCRTCVEINQPTDKWGPRNSMDRLLERYQRMRSDASSARSGLIVSPPSFKSSTSSSFIPRQNYVIRDSIMRSDMSGFLDTPSLDHRMTTP